MQHPHDHSQPIVRPKPPLTDYLPLIAVLTFVVGSALAVSHHAGFSLDMFMMNLMGFFFLYFSLFKLITLPDFAMGYQEYDLIAKRFKAWAWAYPFIEAALGFAFLLGWASTPILWFTIALTAVNTAGILIKLAKREIFQCVCLGTVLKVPLTIVSLVEYAAMGAMAVLMLI